jgi:aldose 1-epimerase
VPAADGSRLTIDLPTAAVDLNGAPDELRLTADGCSVIVDLAAGGRLASVVVHGHELLKTEGGGSYGWGSFPMAPYAGRVRDGTFVFDGRSYRLPQLDPPHALHGTVFLRRWTRVSADTIVADLGPDWPFRGRVSQTFELSATGLHSRMRLEADEPMPASIGWHPWFRRHLDGVAAGRDVALDLDAGAMYRRDGVGIATRERVPPPSGPWDDCFTDLRRPPVLRWPGILELTIRSDCPDWVIYTVPEDALCVEPQTAPPDALDVDPTIVVPGRPLTAEMDWRWRSLAS